MSQDFIQAIYILNPSVISTIGDIAYDIDGNKISYDKTAVESYVSSNAYKAKRAKEYPPITDYIDGVVKGDQAQIQAYIDDCLAVKAKYPKA
jgi:hypothetical protein